MKPTQEQVIAWAREAGYEFNSLGATYTSGRLADLLNSFASLAYEAGRKDENEACAKVCDAAQLFGNIDERWAAKCCSDQIRARKEQ